MRWTSKRSSRPSISPNRRRAIPKPAWCARWKSSGIGRPSTYASILSTLRDRAYVRMDRNRFIPEDKGRLVTSFLESFFGHYVEYDFTADLEEKLDEVSAGDLGWKQLLREFWDGFSAAIGETKDLKITDVINSLNESLRTAHLPGEHARRGSAQMPGLRRTAS